jgi:hypothetical protein
MTPTFEQYIDLLIKTREIAKKPKPSLFEMYTWAIQWQKSNPTLRRQAYEDVKKELNIG